MPQQQYADDTQLYVAITAASSLSTINNLESCLRSLHSWYLHNGLAVNPDKSEAIIFGTSHAVAHAFPSSPSINVAGSTIPFSNQIKLLGVTLDSNLKFDQHITALSKSCFFHIRALRHIRSVLTDDTARTIAASLVGSRLDYANSILYGSSKHNIARVQRIQNALAKVVIGSCPTGHSNSRLQILHWLPIEYRIQYKLAVLTFNARTSTSPYYLSSLINNYHPSRSLRSSNRHLLDVPRSKSVFSSRGFRTAGPQIWNNLPDSVRQSESINVFRTNLKTSLFQSAFSC